MQSVDAFAITRLGIPRLLLMDHAGLALARAVRRLGPSGSPILACCGTGYNGGDGLAALRHLAGWGYPVRALVCGTRAGLREEPAVFARILDRLKVPVRWCGTAAAVRRQSAWMTGSSVLIDALLGIGVRGAPREPIATAIELINASGRPVVCADVPSGMDADTGEAAGVAVKGTVTVAFGAPKAGCRPGTWRVGRLVSDPITLPASLLRGRIR